VTALQIIRTEIEQIGYSTIKRDYVFSDVFEASGVDRKASIAAFTQSPPSYRNAALGVVEANGRDAADVANEFRALGAPLLFVIDGQHVTVWQIHPQSRPTKRQQVPLDQLGVLFHQNRDFWRPQRIQNAKSFGSLNRSYQLDFVDAGLLPAIEGEIHGKLDRLLSKALAETIRLRVVRRGEQVNDQLVFRTIFRLLAAKVLQDREHALADSWNRDEIDSVLQRISGHYKLPALSGESGSLKGSVFDSAWSHLRSGINFRNISSDDLAFVYENTLVTEETRQHFGVHSTPRPVAEYVVSRVQLQSEDIQNATVYEPFAGAGVFMVAALGRLRDLLPVGMTEHARHNFLVKRIRGDEIEPFAREVATLSLILADYPNENGWSVSAVDLFRDNNIAERAKGSQLVLCNPPFEKFTSRERAEYPEATSRSPRKPIAAIDAVLDAKPGAIGFVFPETFIDGQHYRPTRERIEQLYKTIEIVALPDRVFKASDIRSSLLIAQEPRAAKDTITSLRSTTVSVRDRDKFLKSGVISEARSQTRRFQSNSGSLWINELHEVWDLLRDLPRLDSVATVHRGLEWKDNQTQAAQVERRPGFCPGIHSGDAIHVFGIDKPANLDCRPSRLRGGAIKHAWASPKILANAARISRGPWCFAAAIDRRKLVCSQQLFGIWLRPERTALSLEALCAVLNNPLAVAYISSHSPPDRIRVGAVNSLPIPRSLTTEINELVHEYISVLAERTRLFSQFEKRASDILNEIDAEILAAYDLPPRLERRVLEYFRGEVRPTLHEWKHWFPENFGPFIPLREYLSPQYQKAVTPWVQKVFAPLPQEEAEALANYMD
jgi:type I restriction-modification system DNA methylase subunit